LRKGRGGRDVAFPAREVAPVGGGRKTPGYQRRKAGRETGSVAEVTVLWWRDIPAQVIAGRGRRGAKRALPERFEQAIDRCAMKVGARDSDAYMAEWRRGAPEPRPGSEAEAAEAEAARLEADYTPARLRGLIENHGWAPAEAGAGRA
jgi:hypothetical protein